MTARANHRTLLPKSNRQYTNQQQNINNNNESIKQKQKISEQLKQKYIQDLQERNIKLKNQIVKITQLLEISQNQNKNVKMDPKKFKSKIAQSLNQKNPQVLKKQLQNVYKQIKNYEREIQKTQNTKGGSSNASDQIAKLQIIKLQKLQHLDKLKTQLSGLTNAQVSISKKLKNNMGRQYYQNIVVKQGEDLKVLRQKLRGLEQKQKKKVQNAKKQLEYIRKLQAELVQSGVAMDQIQEMKRKNIYVQVKNIMNRQKNPQKSQQKLQKINGDIQQQDQQQMITNQKLEQMKNEIKLYRKLHFDYEKRLNTIMKQKQNADRMIGEKKKILEEKNLQIDKLNQEISEVKQLVRKNNIVIGTLGMGSQGESNKKQKRKSIQINLENSGKKNDTKLLNKK